MTKHRLPPDPEFEQQLLAFPTVRLDETDPTLVDYWAVDDFPEGWPPQLSGSPGWPLLAGTRRRAPQWAVDNLIKETIRAARSSYDDSTALTVLCAAADAARDESHPGHVMAWHFLLALLERQAGGDEGEGGPS